MKSNGTTSIAGKIIDSNFHRRCAKMTEQGIVSEFMEILMSPTTSVSKHTVRKWENQIQKPGHTNKVMAINNIVLSFEGLKIGR